MKLLTENQSKVLAFLEANPSQFHTPTQIAKAVWPATNKHSSTTSPILKKLVEKGLVRKLDGIGAYKYRTT